MSQAEVDWVGHLMALQFPSPADAETWGTSIERGGIIGLLTVGLVAVLIGFYRQHQHMVRMYETQLTELKTERRELLELALRGSVGLEKAVDVLKRR